MSVTVLFLFFLAYFVCFLIFNFLSLDEFIALYYNINLSNFNYIIAYILHDCLKKASNMTDYHMTDNVFKKS